jgi:hypothetical protein
MTTLAWLSSNSIGEDRIYHKWEIYMMKYGKFFRLKQSYFFKKWNSIKVEFYSYKAYKQENNLNLVPLISKTIGKGAYLMGTSKLPYISPATLPKRISEIASQIIQFRISTSKTYEAAERKNFIGDKNYISISSLYRLIWIKHPLKRKLEKLAVLIWVIVEPTKLCEKLLDTSRFHSPKLFLLTG